MSDPPHSDTVTDRIELVGLRGFGHHGVLPQERQDGQTFVLDVGLEVDTRTAARSDDLADTIDYAELADKLVAMVAGEPVDLIETLAARLADVALADGRVKA